MPPVLELWRNALTYDRGHAMARHTQVSADCNLTVYFADPHALWQRSSNAESVQVKIDKNNA